MARYVADQNVTALYYESGTYGTPSGAAPQWIGLVQDANPDDSVGTFKIRYQGTGTRNVGVYALGPRDHNVNLTYYPQDFKMLIFALGSNVDAGSPSPYTHTISELNNGSMSPWVSGAENPFSSFSLEHSQRAPGTGTNYNRSYRGCVVNTWTLNIPAGDLITAEAEIIAQSVVHGSGTVTMPTEDTTRPFVWSDARFHFTSGTILDKTTNITFRIDNGFDPRHYDNGSAVIAAPVAGNRNYSVEISHDGNSEWNKTLYEQYFLGGSEFNSILEVSASTGSRDAFFFLSGARITAMTAPGGVEGVNEQSLTIEPKSCNVLVNDLTFKYSPW